MSFLDHTADWASPLSQTGETLRRRSTRPFTAVNRSYAEASLEDESALHDESRKKRLDDSVSSLRDQVQAQMQVASDESRQCYKLLSDQLLALDTRLRVQEKDSGNKLELYKMQAELENRVMRQGQEVKAAMGEYAKLEDLKSLEDAMKRANALRLQTLEYRLKELSASSSEMQTVIQQLLARDRPSVASQKSEDLITQVYTATVQRVEKLLERELIPILRDQELRLSAVVEKRIHEVKEEQRPSLRVETDLKQRMNYIEESFQGLIRRETSFLKSQTPSSELRRTTDSQVREDLRTLEKTFTQSLNQLKCEMNSLSKPDFSLQSDLFREIKGDLARQIESEVASHVRNEAGKRGKEEEAGKLREEMIGLIGKTDNEVRDLAKRQREVAEELGKLGGSLEATIRTSIEDLRKEQERREQSTAGLSKLREELKTSIEQLKSDISTSFLRLTSAESRLAELEERQFSANGRSEDAISSISIEKEQEEAHTFDLQVTEGKVVSQGARMKGGIRGIQQLHLEESSDEFRAPAQPQKNLLAGQAAATIVDTFIEEELNFCVAALKGGELVLSSLDSYREVNRGTNSPLISWDPDEEQDDGTNLSDRRVDLRSRRRAG